MTFYEAPCWLRKLAHPRICLYLILQYKIPPRLLLLSSFLRLLQQNTTRTVQRSRKKEREREKLRLMRDKEGKHKVFKVGFFKKLSRHSWRLKFYWSSLRWKRVHLPVSFVDDLVFKIVSLFEAIVLVLSLCLFYLFFGCHF